MEYAFLRSVCLAILCLVFLLHHVYQKPRANLVDCPFPWQPCSSLPAVFINCSVQRGMCGYMVAGTRVKNSLYRFQINATFLPQTGRYTKRFENAAILSWSVMVPTLFTPARAMIFRSCPDVIEPIQHCQARHKRDKLLPRGLFPAFNPRWWLATAILELKGVVCKQLLIHSTVAVSNPITVMC